MDNLVNNTLSAWLLIESLEPGEVKYTDHSVLNKSVFLNNENQEKLQSFPSYYDIWNADKFKLSERAKNNGKLNFRLYRNCFMYKEIDGEIRDIFKDDRERFLILIRLSVMDIRLKLMILEKLFLIVYIFL
ncbi:hypothetical protein [Mammaliicoccus sciuri]|uniref:hypothetical protein n=1 Tax=Mammaliicoccus sciuri TaxID=1296 RepID=UPI003F556AFF